MRALAVSTPERAAVLPDVPTVREAGYPEVESTNWSGLVVPAATPPSAISRLNAELVRALRNAEIQESSRPTECPLPRARRNSSLRSCSPNRRGTRKSLRQAGIKAD